MEVLCVDWQGAVYFIMGKNKPNFMHFIRKKYLNFKRERKQIACIGSGNSNFEPLISPESLKTTQ